MGEALLVALGAAVGAPLRFLTMHVLRSRFGATPTVGTLSVNIAGSFVLGVAAATGLHGAWLGLVGVGFCGALTTFSTLALELWEGWVDGERRHAVANLVLTLVLGLGAAFLGWLVGAR